MPENDDNIRDMSELFDAFRPKENISSTLDGKNWIDDVAEENQGFAGELVRKEKQKNEERFKYAEVFLRRSTAWLVFLALVVIAHGLHFVPFSLSDTILGILLGTTTLNILGPYFLIARYLFNGNGKNHHAPN